MIKSYNETNRRKRSSLVYNQDICCHGLLCTFNDGNVVNRLLYLKRGVHVNWVYE